MDNRLNETRRKISFLRSEMLVTEDIIRKQINRDEDCTEASLRLMAMRWAYEDFQVSSPSPHPRSSWDSPPATSIRRSSFASSPL